MPIRLAFHGAASTVTGSCYLVEHDRGRFLVDCGLFQGTKTVRELNYGPFPFAAQGIDFVLLVVAAGLTAFGYGPLASKFKSLRSDAPYAEASVGGRA